MRRVQDPQFDRRLSELEAHRRKLPRLSLPEASTLKPQDKETIASPSSTPRALPPSRAPNQPSESTAPVSGLSSPPSSVGNAHSQDDPMKTPTQTSHRRTYTAGSPMQLSSPPATVSRRDECLRTPTAAADASPQDDSATDKRLVTPAQRGDAVDGLLKLMNTGEKCKDSSPWTGSANSG
ncbi:hypothetical protein EYZ11_001489 [Aspergillus tanneri]|nr:hypothetical protein EYZ11_001489 [Aspergillus tanneri]